MKVLTKELMKLSGIKVHYISKKYMASVSLSRLREGTIASIAPTAYRSHNY
jgi:hypothetical protein